MAKQKPIEDLNYEEAFAELEEIISLLEAGEQPLDNSIDVFVRGQALVKRCAELLEKAELKVRLLTGETLTDMEEAE